MCDIDTFLTTLYVDVDDFCKTHLPAPDAMPGRPASLACSEVITLALFRRWNCFPSDRAFDRFARLQLRSAFPHLPHRAQLNRLLRQQRQAYIAYFLHLCDRLHAHCAPYQALDTTGVPVRDRKRRGEGWLWGQVDLGWSNRRGWYEGFHVLSAVTPEGVLTGFGFGPASVNDHPLAETFFALRAQPCGGYGAAVGRPAQGCYLADSGFVGATPAAHWRACYGARVLAPPQRNQHPRGWTPPLRRWAAGLRQVVETVYARLFHTFRLEQERPHALEGFQARLAASMALHNFCIWLNRQLGRPNLAFADLIDW